MVQTKPRAEEAVAGDHAEVPAIESGRPERVRPAGRGRQSVGRHRAAARNRHRHVQTLHFPSFSLLILTSESNVEIVTQS